MAATVIHLEAARSALAMAEMVTRYAEVTAQVKELEAEAKALRARVLAELDYLGTDALEVSGHTVSRSYRRAIQQEAAVATLDAAGLADCVQTVRMADAKAAEAAVTLGLLDRDAWSACFSVSPVLTVKAH